MIIHCVWEHNGNDTLLYAVDFVGAYTRGESLEIAKAKMPQEIVSYCNWLGMEAEGKAEIVIVGEKCSELTIRDADSDVLFESEQPPLTIEEYETLKTLALKSAKDFLALYESIPDKDAAAAPERKTFYGQVPRTANEMYEHTKNVNTYYFAEIAVEADHDGNIYECRKRGFESLESNPDFLQNTVRKGSYGEDWSLRKVLRRFIWHDRIHAKAMYRMAIKVFGAENVGFHVGTEAVRMDTSVPISPEGLRQAELAANRIVWQDVPVLISYPTREELAALVYRSKKEIEGQVRIVTIPGADVCACCGTHTRTTGQVGQIKILASENYKGGVRLSVVCGARALAAAQAMRARQADIGALLSAEADQTAVAVHRVYDEYTALKFTHFGLCSQLFDALAQLTAPDADAIRTLSGLDPDGLHRLAVRLTEATTGLCAALTPTEKGTGYCLARRDGDVRALTKALNAALNGRGGGKPGICQGSCAATPEQVERFLKENNKL